MPSLSPQKTVGDLVKDRPARSRVFERLKIDYCCGGRLPLADACAKRGLEVAQVLEQLHDDDRSQTQDDALVDADAMGLTELVDHIEQTHHAYLHRELPRLGQMVRRVAAVHGDRYPWMLEVDGVYGGLVGEMESHTLKEEQRLFPLIRDLDRGAEAESNRGQRLADLIDVMEHEHDDAGGALSRLRTLTQNFTPPADACNTFRAMLDGLAQLEADLHQHVHKENNVLFPKALAREAAQTGETNTV